MSATVYLNRDEVLLLSADIDVEGALERVLVQAEKGGAGQSVRTELVPEGLSAVLGIMPAYRSELPAALAAKLVCVVPANPSRGMPAHQGIAVLFDGENGSPRVLADAGAVTEVRSAALTALATRVLAADPTGPSLVVGGGHQAAAHLRALAGSGRRLRVWARRPEQAANLAARLAEEGVEIIPEPDLERAVSSSSVVTLVTGAASPVIEDAWVQQGTLVNAVGSSTPRVCEVPEQTIRTSRLIVDDVAAVTCLAGEIARLAAPLPEMTTLGAVLAGTRVAPSGPDRRTVFKAVGVALSDLALLDELAAKAATSTVGQRLVV